MVATNANGSSATSPIKAPFTGSLSFLTSGGAPVPDCVTGGTCEAFPVPSEYDYYPTPKITSVTTTSADDSTTWASEAGDTIATIDGSGFDSLGFLYTIDGNPSVYANQDTNTLSVTPTEIQVIINGRGLTHLPVATRLTVATLAGNSAPATFDYAGEPILTNVSPPFGPTAGGTPITISGADFDGINAADGGALLYTYLVFDGASPQLSGYAASGDGTTVTATTPQNPAGEFLLQACTITTCSEPTSEQSFINSLFDFYEPGAPVVTSVTKQSGPASGGTRLEIHGVNLSDAIEVVFGSTVAEAASAPQFLTNGSNTEIDAIAPPGKAGSKVNIRVLTVEALATGGHLSKTSSADTFTYQSSVASAPQHVTAHAVNNSVTVHWKVPASNGGHPITSYRVSAIALPNSPKKGAKKPPTIVVVTKHASARSAKLTGLRGGWAYEIKVQAINSKGRGLPGEPNQEFFISDPS